MSKPAILYTIDDVIAAFGGTKAVAEWAGVGMSAISNWSERGIPAGWHYRIDRELRGRGFEIDPSVFGCPPHDQQEKARLTATR